MEETKRLAHSWRFHWGWVLILLVGVLFAGWLVFTPPGLLGKADAVGYAVCHRIDGRSFHLGDRQAPLCVRCTGQYLGAALGLTYQGVFYRRRSGGIPGRLWPVMFLFVLAYGVDGLNSYLHLPLWTNLFPDIPKLYEPHNTLRLVTGSGMGLVLAGVLYPVFNGTIWRQMDRRPALAGYKPFFGLVLLAGIWLGLISTGQSTVLYLSALVSAGGVLALLTIVYSMVWLIALRKENSIDNTAQLFFPLLGGFFLAIFQIALLDLGRYLLTGSWDGFSIG